jgi:hypothetical protein
VKLVVQSIVFKAVPYTRTQDDHFSFDDGVEFERTDRGFTPVFEEIEIDASWLQGVKENTFFEVQDIGEMIAYRTSAEWGIAINGFTFYIQIDPDNNLVTTGKPELFTFLFNSGVVLFRD